MLKDCCNMTHCGCYENICESCLQEVLEGTSCQYCCEDMDPMEIMSCDQCDMVVKPESWHQCLAVDCPVKERLNDNCCKS